MLAIINGTEEQNMKTYQSTTKDKRKTFFKRHWHAFVIVGSVLVVAAVITLSLVFTLPKSGPVDGPVNPPSDIVDSDPKVVAPMNGATIGLDYANDKLVYWETLEVWRTHPAVDYIGEGDVLAIMDGTVTDVEMHTTLDGNVVTITHADGYVSVYKSLGDDIAVKKGDKVKAGDKLGTTSDSMMSELKTGAHLHLELKKDGKYVDPNTLLPTEDK